MKTTATLLRYFLPPALLLTVSLTTPGGAALPASGTTSDAPSATYVALSGPAPEAGGEALLTLSGPSVSVAAWQWQRKAAGTAEWAELPEGFPYLGVATPALRVAPATLAMDGDQFRCLVRSLDGQTTASASATLRVGPPLLAVLGGDGQTAASGQFNARPFDLAVWDAAGTHPQAGTPVTFTVQSGGGTLAPAATADAVPAATLTLQTDADGAVQAWYRHAAFAGVQSEIKATAGSREILLHTATLDASGAVSSGGSTGSTTTGDGTSRPPVVGPSRGAGGVFAGATAASNADAKAHAAAAAAGQHALTLPANLTLKIKAASTYYLVNTSTWEISPAPN